MEVGRLECLPPEQSMQTLFSPGWGSRWLWLPSPDMVPPAPSVSLGLKECSAQSSSLSGRFSWPKAMLGFTGLWACWEPQGTKARSHGGAQGHGMNKCCYMRPLDILLLSLHIFSLNGLKHSYYFIYHLYADSFPISVFSPAFSPEPQTQITQFLLCEQKLNAVLVKPQESF